MPFNGIYGRHSLHRAQLQFDYNQLQSMATKTTSATRTHTHSHTQMSMASLELVCVCVCVWGRFRALQCGCPPLSSRQIVFRLLFFTWFVFLHFLKFFCLRFLSFALIWQKRISFFFLAYASSCHSNVWAWHSCIPF